MTDSTRAASRQAGTLQGILLLLPMTMAVMGLIVLVPVMPAMMEHFHDVPGSASLVQLVLTVPALCVALLSPVAGAIVDFFGRRRTLIGGLVIYAAVGVLPMLLDNLNAILASRIALGMVESAVVTASTTLIGDYFHDATRARWLANQTAVASLSSIVLALLGGALGASFGWRGPFIAYALSLVYVIGLLLWTWEPSKSEQPAANLTSQAVHLPWNKVLPVALLAVFGGTMFFLMQIQVTNVLSDYYGVKSSSALGLFTSAAGLSVAIGTLLYKQIMRIPLTLKLMIAFGMLGLSYVMMNHISAIPAFTTWLVINQLACGILLPSLVVAAMASLPFEVRGRGTGIFMMGWWLGQPISAQAATLVRQQMNGSPPATLQLFGALCLVAAAIALVLHLARGRAAAATG